ncbi:MAG TPA: SDR family NAD(P)-dependent oxidoreductase [Micromonosporaceae bacterium]|jgi:NAD(P)-dependent dehydrogenase (short-subunit alcohol dehydrogenase family)/catechol 2,3-dioxygenase-like lactoylglutathione lyase family enzyme
MPTAIITGASKGLGLALATELADAGWNLIIDARDADALHRAADAIRTAGSAACRAAPSGDGDRVLVEPIAGDITDPAHRAALIRAAQAHGRLDLLVNNAGTLGPSPLPAVAAVDPASLRATFEVNTVAPLALTQLALPLLRTSGGTVIDVTSDAAVEGYPGWGAYGASKAATEQLRNVLAAEETGIVVWRVDPGDLRTDMHQLAFPGEDISDRPLPSEVAPGLLRLLFERPPSGRYRLADFAAPAAAATETAVTEAAATEAAPTATAVTETAQAAGPAPNAPIGLWLTVEVDDHAKHHAFYRDVLGLPEIDGWSIDGEVGTVFAVGPAGRIEIEHPAFPETPEPGVRAAIEYADADALSAAHDRAGDGSPITVHARGHAGFTVRDPYGAEIYLWTERWDGR